MDFQRFYYQGDGTSSQNEERNRFSNQENKGLLSGLYTKMIFATVGVIALVAIISSTITSPTNSRMESSTGVSNSKLVSIPMASDLNFRFDIQISTPGYGPLQNSLIPWKLVVEPARAQIISIKKFSLNNENVALSDEKVSVDWEINGNTYSGVSAEFQVPATSFGQKMTFSVRLTPKSGVVFGTEIDAKYSFTHRDQFIVKYIRREIRALTDSDRQKFMNALQTIYSVSELEGQKKFGSKFHNIEYYLYKHLNGAGRNDCDHWHDGAGIITHHAAYTAEFEQSIQAIEPSIAMPYWEYGMDAYLYSNLDQSPIFNREWLGEYNPPNSDHIINDGSFWANTKVLDGTKYRNWDISKEGSLNPFVNAYGAMRSPWNNNPTSGIGRRNTTYGKSQYPSVPSCSSLRACFQEKSLAEMNYCLNGDTHGPVHIMIGGAWGDDEIEDKQYEYIQNPDKILLFKVLWRLGYTRCPTTCELGQQCRCAIPEEYYDSIGVEKMLSDSNIVYVLDKILANANEDTMKKILKTVEHPGIAGEMFTSAASFDPTFWPLHGSMERMLNYKRIMVEQGVITGFDETWGYPEYDKSSGAAYLYAVCDWSNVKSNEDLTLPKCSFDEVCPGHFEEDVLEFSNFLNKGETYTNIEMYYFLHPWNEELPYTYDTFDFDYCSEKGYDFLDFSTVDSSAKQQSLKGVKRATHKSTKEEIDEEERLALRRSVVSGM